MPLDLTLGPSAPARPATPASPRRPPRHLADLDPAARRQALVDLGAPAFRGDQLSRHYFTRLDHDPAAEPAVMTDLPAAERHRLADVLLPPLLDPIRAVVADAGATRKTLWRAVDGVLVESVLMRYRDRTTVCVSSQAGCGMACPFCATGQAGLTRNLSTAEIVEQVVATGRGLHRDGAGRVSNVVFMGMGEPLANYARVVSAVRRLTDPAPHGVGLSQRNLVVSTVGLAPAMRRLAGEGLAVTLALSLHAPDDELRSALLPVNTRWPVAEVLDAAWEYAGRTGRRISFEYVLLGGVNDQPERAELLARLLRGRLAHVNLIPLNPTPGGTDRPSTPEAEREFARRLRAAGVTTTIRDTRGREIAGACGQLAATG